MAPHQLPEVDVNRHRQLGRARRHFQHLPGADPSGLARLIRERKPRVAFERNQSVGAVRTGFEDDCRPRDGNGDRRAPDRAAAGIFRHPQQDRAALDVRGAPGFAESKNRIGPEARDREVGKRQLGARFVARPHAGVLGHFVIDERIAWVRLGGKNLYLANDLGDLRLLGAGRDCR
jgi:hypothetical protein